MRPVSFSLRSRRIFDTLKGMKRVTFFFTLAVTLLGVLPVQAATSSEKAKEALGEAVRKAEYAFNADVRNAYLNYIEALTREKYGPKVINEATWTWFKQRPQILSAAAAAAYPYEPNVLLNFQRLGRALGSVKLDQWRQLALAYAIRWRAEPFPHDTAKEEWNPARLESLVSEKRKGKGGDFALTDATHLPDGITDEEIALGEWIVGPQSLGSVRPKLTIPDLMEMPLHEINMMVRKKPDDPPMLSKFPNWDHVALGGGVYPPSVDGTPTPQRAVLMKIFRNGRIPNKTNRPNFRMEKSEWPILLYVADLAQIDETSFIFNYLVTKKEIPALGLGQMPTASGSSDASVHDPNFKYRRSNWHPSKFIRLYNGSKKDQGGRAWAWGLNAVNVAATEVAAPPDGKFYYMGERGNYTHFLTCADNAFTGVGSEANWYLAPPCTVDNVEAFSSGKVSASVLHSNFIGLATTLNQGLQEYEDARIALAVIETLDMPRGRSLTMLESVFLQNPLNQDILFKLASAYRHMGDAKSTINMLNAARAYAATGLKLPVSPAAAKTARGTMPKIFRRAEPSYQGVPVISVNQSPWFFLTCSEIASQFLHDTNGKDKALFKAELDYEVQAAQGCGDKPIERAVENLRRLIN